ncbi:unnamed protein product [Didymodactylos carnosus]|nr:unnamed protein product [Didymodactylos carnosus]CAF4338360.1 unnamed protein product [Didymodactylos carnosus]
MGINPHVDVSETDLDYTLSFWFTAAETGPLVICTLREADKRFCSSIAIMVNGRSEFALHEMNSGSTNVLLPIELKANEWYHLCLKQNSVAAAFHREQELWINGLLCVKGKFYMKYGITELNFRQLLHRGCCLADICMWNRCLTKLEICAIAGQGRKVDDVNVAEYLVEKVLHQNI